MYQHLPPLALDLLEIAAYVYCADQSKTRGGATFPRNGADWYRQFELSIPVRLPERWRSTEVKHKLTTLLGFLSEDTFTFNFRGTVRDVSRDAYFALDEGKPWFKPDSILLFSGGLDSLTGAVEELQDPNRKVMLVSHRPVSTIDKSQRDLMAALARRFDASRRILHVPVWVNKDKGITKDANQRTRSFLYASIATVLAMMTESNAIKFYENGIVSCNLPISRQVVGARASRSTHPKSLKLMSDFFSALLDRSFSVRNPFLAKTKTDVLELLKHRDTADLIIDSHSCTRTRSTTGYQNHCGVCSQCIERRIAVMANDLESCDPEDRYQSSLFLNALDRREDLTMVESYIQHAGLLETMSDFDFVQHFPDFYTIIGSLDGKPNEAGQMIYDLHKRHGTQVGSVVRAQIESNAEMIRKRKIHPKSLLGIIVGESITGPTLKRATYRFPTPENTKWDQVIIEILSRDSLRVSVGRVSQKYVALDIGFRDKRKVDLPNKQWELLCQMAESGGVINWSSSSASHTVGKQIESLNRILREFFGLSDNPISRYRKQVGWAARFRIVDKSFGK